MNREEYQRWREKTLKPTIDSQKLRQEKFTRSGGEEIRDLYTDLDLVSTNQDADIGLPGEYPFTRGVYPTMYRGQFWTMRQYSGFGSAADTNARFRYLLSQGQTGLSVAFDLPTQMGYDADHPMAQGEVGKVGVAISSLHDMRRLFDQIPLEKVSTSMTINSTAAILLAMYVAVAKEQGTEPQKLRGTLQNDVLKEYIARGTYIYPPRPSMRIVTDIFRWCAKNAPRWNTISISGYHIREAGSTAAQELAFTLADGIAYVEAAIQAGLPIDTFAPRLSFFFNAHNNFLEEVAKFRAARRLWARMMKERFGAQETNSLRLRFHTQTAGCTLTARHIDNNVVRVTLQALAAVLGGTQSLHTNSRDEALALPSTEAATIALRTQQIIAHESGVTSFVDPLGGSWAVESMTDELEDSARRYIAEIDAMGGMVAAIEAGYPQREIQNAAYAQQVAVDRKEQMVLGVNLHAEGGEHLGEILRIKPELGAEQMATLSTLRNARDAHAAASCLDRLKQAAAGTENLVDPILAAVTAGVTLGEVSDALRSVFGVYKANVVF
jgi:methylmalonyl-CoA mutase, N-terminal domain